MPMRRLQDRPVPSSHRTSRDTGPGWRWHGRRTTRQAWRGVRPDLAAPRPMTAAPQDDLRCNRPLRRRAMTIELLNPDGLPKPDVYRQVAVAQGSKIVFLSAQVARDADGNAVGIGDLAAQVDQALRNIATAVSAVGGSFADV